MKAETQSREHFEIQPVVSCALTDVAGFLHRWRRGEDTDAGDQDRVRETAASLERRLRWLLLENPAARERPPLGYCLRDAAGVIQGLTLCYPAAFLTGGRRILGLGAGSYFVAAQARSLGFYLFKKYLSVSGYSFHFSTTCNAISSGLWKQLGGSAVPKSDIEYILPLRLDRIAPALVARKTSRKAGTGIVRFLGQCANPALRLLTRPKAELTVELCQDWEKLSELSRKHRPANYITSDRSVEFLQWRYGPASPLRPCEIYLFRDKQGNEGWFSLGNLFRGRHVQLRGSVLLDAIWPREKMSFSSILHEIVRLTPGSADAIVLRPQPGLNYRESSRWIVPYKLPAPRAFVKTGKGLPPLALDLLDYDDSDYGTWARHWTDTDACRTLSYRPALRPAGLENLASSRDQG